MVSLRASTQAWREVLRTSSALMHAFEAAGDFGDLSPREYDVLRALAEGPHTGCRLGALAEETYLPQPSMSGWWSVWSAGGWCSAGPAPPTGVR